MFSDKALEVSSSPFSHVTTESCDSPTFFIQVLLMQPMKFLNFSFRNFILKLLHYLPVTSVFSRYTTAYAESDYTDRDSDRDERGRESEQESEEEEDRSCATVLTLQQEDSQEEEMEERGILEEEEEEEKDEQLVIEAPPNGELALLLAQSDILHTGDATLKAEGFRLLLDNRAEVRDDHLTDLKTDGTNGCIHFIYTHHICSQ